jgi:sigma-54 dependent transcriptional regulator, acetoin dehydrogenase operon transcriptional activator AcoR
VRSTATSTTRSSEASRRVDGDAMQVCEQLFVVLYADAPLSPSSRHLLAGVDTVRIGRADDFAALRQAVGAERVLQLWLPDRQLSKDHAVIQRVRGRWVLRDSGSKNGTVVNGVETRRAVLADGDIVEVGHTILRYRDGGRPVARDLPDLLANDVPAPGGLRTFSPDLAEVYDGIRAVAPSPISVVILGETGTGKEVVARALHAMSGRAGPFVAVNCGAIPPALLEAELFGYRKGAFTGAAKDSPGLVRAADGGTLFLDEIGDLALASQVALLRVLQEREVVPVGGTSAVPVDVRVVTATHRDLPAMVEREAFRRDLYGRLAGYTARLPPLRARKEDFGLLVAALLPRVAAKIPATFRASAARTLLAHDWPLNIRELEQCLTTATVLAAGKPIELRHLPEGVGARPDSPPLLTDEEREHRDRLVELLAEHGGNVAAVAGALGKRRMQIHRWAKRYGLVLDSFRRRAKVGDRE